MMEALQEAGGLELDLGSYSNYLVASWVTFWMLVKCSMTTPRGTQLSSDDPHRSLSRETP